MSSNIENTNANTSLSKNCESPTIEDEKCLVKNTAALSLTHKNETSLSAFQLLKAMNAIVEYENVDGKECLTAELDEYSNWDCGVQTFAEIVGPELTQLKFIYYLSSLNVMKIQLKGVLKSFKKLTKLDVHSVDDAIYLEFPDTVKSIHVFEFPCKMTEDSSEVLQSLKKGGIVLTGKRMFYERVTRYSDQAVTFPKLNGNLEAFMEQFRIRRFEANHENVLEVNEFQFLDITRLYHYITPNELQLMDVKDLQSLKTLKLKPDPDGCFFAHDPIKFEKARHIAIHALNNFNIPTCYGCIQCLKSSCTNIESLLLNGDFEQIAALLSIAPKNLRHLRMIDSERPLCKVSLKFSQLEKLVVGFKNYYQGATDEWFKCCTDWVQMDNLTELVIKSKMYVDEEILTNLAKKCPNLKIINIRNNEYFTSELKLLAESLWKNARVTRKTTSHNADKADCR